MEFYNYTLPELITIGAITPFAICAVIALFDFDWLNNIVMSFYGWIDEKYEGTSSWFWKPFYGILRLPTILSSPVSHTGWKSGLSIGLGTFSIVALLTVLYFVALIAIAIVSVIVVLFIIGAVLGGKK